MGPGATPGPICYGRGGTAPTITDANLILGRLNPDKLLAVDKPVSVAEVGAIILEKVGRPLGLDATGAAAAILRIANDRMAGAIRMVSLARGHDPRDYVLFPFGGAGPLHAAALARELAIPKLLIPVRPGITNALGCVVADARHDYVNTVNKPLPALDINLVWSTLQAQIAEGRATLARERVAIEGTRILHFADMQFQGQSHILTLALPQLQVAKEELQRLFEAAYWERFGVELPEIRAVLVNLHTAVIGLRPRLDLSVLARAGRAPDLKSALNGTRAVWFEGGFRDTPIYQREKLPLDANFAGPAIIEQLDCTTVIDPGNRVELDALGNLLVTV